MSSLLSTVRCFWLSLTEFVKTPSGKRSSPRLSDTRRSLSDSALKGRQHQHLTLEEVTKHTSREDCWIIIKNRVYDVSSFGKVHPGGEVIFTQGGRDATDVFTSFHAASTWGQLTKYCIGDLTETDDGEETETESLLEDFRQLRRTFMEKGLFKADGLFYVRKMTVNLSILFCSVAMLMTSNVSWLWLLMAAFLMGLFWQQMGWLAHDFCHHQVFKNRRWNNVFGYITGNVFQGFSVDWWKRKHNTHHAVTNAIDMDHSAVDPDIDTLPLLAWSAEMLKTLTSPAERVLIRYQHYFFIPILFLARFSWAQQSFSHSLSKYRNGGGTLDFALVVLHYVWCFAVAFWTLSPLKAILFLVLSQILSGFMLGLSFVQSHNGMEIHGDAKNFVTSQVITTRDITYSLFVDFFMGGLNYQIEHHLFPTMPRHNLRRAQVAVKALCKKHGLPYEECTMDVGTRRVVQRLIDVAKHA